MNYYQLSRKSPVLTSLINRSASLGFRFIRRFIPKKKGDGPVLILSLHKLGDSVLTIPAIGRLVVLYGNSSVLLTFEENLAIYKTAFPEMKYLTCTKKDFAFGRAVKRDLRRRVRQLNPGVIIDLTGTILTAGLIFNSRAEKIIGISEAQYSGIYDLRVQTIHKKHISEIYSNIADAAGAAQIYDLIIPHPTETASESVLILPSAGWKEKEWPLSRFIQCAREISSKAVVTILFQSGSVDRDILTEIEDLGLNVVETETTAELIEEIKKHSLILCNDSGPSHIADLMGKPNLTLFGPANPSHHKSDNPGSPVLFARLKCSPIEDKICFANGGRECPSNECMRKIMTEEVLEITGKLL